MNKCLFIGRLGKDNNLTYAPSGTAICKNSLAITEKWTDKNGQKQEKTEWINFFIFGKGAEIFNQYTQKGSQVFLEGKFQTDSYEKNGSKVFATKVNVSDFKFLNTIGGAEKASNESQFTADDLPF